LKINSRKSFLTASSALFVAGCAGGSAMRLLPPRSGAASARNPEVCIANQPNCGRPTPDPTYSNDETLTASSGASGRIRYNSIALVVTSGLDSSGRPTSNGNIKAISNSDNSVTSNHNVNLTVPGQPSSVNASHVIPYYLRNSFTFVDSNNVTHSASVTSSGSGITVTDSFYLNGSNWSFTVASPDGQQMTISWVTASGNHSFTFQAPQLSNCGGNHAVVASAETIHSDAGNMLAEEVAIHICCACVARQSELGFGIAGISAGLGVLAGATGIGLALVPFFEGYAALTLAYAGVLAVAHGFAC